MIVHERVPLSSLTTLKVGGEARYVIECWNERDVREALAFARTRDLPFYVLGQGSNVCAPDAGYEGVVFQLTDASCRIDGDREAIAVCGAGLSWDAFVDLVTERELWGVENLAGIPGTVGAAPVQNIGAYGAELADTFLWLDAVDARTGAVTRFHNSVSQFGYRDSRFKRDPELIIFRVALQLSTGGAPRVSYPDLARLVEAGRVLATPAEIAAAVREVRSRKFPDLRECGTAGSFFKNPVISQDAYKALVARYPGLPAFAMGDSVKVPLAWILDNVLSLRGYSKGPARLFEQQPLVLVTSHGARACDVEALASEVAARVFDATGITIEREVRSM